MGPSIKTDLGLNVLKQKKGKFSKSVNLSEEYNLSISQIFQSGKCLLAPAADADAMAGVKIEVSFPLFKKYNECFGFKKLSG